MPITLRPRWTRQECIRGDCDYYQYHRQFVQGTYPDVIADYIGHDRLRATGGDMGLIGLHKWLVAPEPYQFHRMLREAGDVYTDVIRSRVAKCAAIMWLERNNG